MTKLTVYNFSSRKTSSIEVDAAVFGIEPNVDVVAQAMRVYTLNKQTGLAHTKTRAEVRGGGKKPWKQKGTGRARASSSRSPLWEGGGTIFGPRKHAVTARIPKKMKQLALRSCLSSKAKDGAVIIYEKLSLATPKTKQAHEHLQPFLDKGTVLVIGDTPNVVVRLAVRNIPSLQYIDATLPSIYDVLRYDIILIDKAALPKFSFPSKEETPKRKSTAKEASILETVALISDEPVAEVSEATV